MTKGFDTLLPLLKVKSQTLSDPKAICLQLFLYVSHKMIDKVGSAQKKGKLLPWKIKALQSNSSWWTIWKCLFSKKLKICLWTPNTFLASLQIWISCFFLGLFWRLPNWTLEGWPFKAQPSKPVWQIGLGWSYFGRSALRSRIGELKNSFCFGIKQGFRCTGK